MRFSNIGCGGTLGVTVPAIVKTVRGVGGHTERGAKAIAADIGAAAKWARIKFDVAHLPRSRNIRRRSGEQHFKCVWTVAGVFRRRMRNSNARSCKTQDLVFSLMLSLKKQVLHLRTPYDLVDV
jgi:hypothetical protein